MALPRTSKMIGKRAGIRLGFLWLALAPGLGMVGPGSVLSRADEEVGFRAEVDRPQVSLDESVSLKLIIETDGGGARVTEPEFSAPGFELLNEYRSTRSMLTDINGTLTTKSTVEITKVLRPAKVGTQKISGLHVRVGAKVLSAPDVNVVVVAGGARTPPPRNYGTNGGVGLRGSGRHAPASVFLKAEIDKDRVFKGEQLVASYYLYQRVKVFNIDVNKYPVLGGFLREDLEMPLITRQLLAERVSVDGVPYDRYLLVRYAAYPLQEGKLKIDPMALKYSYYGAPAGMDADSDDPFRSFFQQLAPRSGTTHSDPINIDVLPLPDAGRPSSFTGAVGDFEVTAAVDKIDVKANEPVTLTVKIEGRGNTAAIGEPKARWPDGVELYDTKGRAKTGRAGVGEKVFEFLLIPRSPGRLELPAMEFSYFDPAKKSYVIKATQPVAINVGEGAAGTPAYIARPKTIPTAAAPGEPSRAVVEPDQIPLGLKLPEQAREGIDLGQPIWRWLYWLFGAVLFLFVTLVASDVIRRTFRAPRPSKEEKDTRSWKTLHEFAESGARAAPWPEVSQAYERLSGLVFDAIDAKYRIGARSLPRAELRRILVGDHRVADETWIRLEKVLEYTELVRFTSAAGAVESSARTELRTRVADAETAVRTI